MLDGLILVCINSGMLPVTKHPTILIIVHPFKWLSFIIKSFTTGMQYVILPPLKMKDEER